MAFINMNVHGLKMMVIPIMEFQPIEQGTQNPSTITAVEFNETLTEGNQSIANGIIYHSII